MSANCILSLTTPWLDLCTICAACFVAACRSAGLKTTILFESRNPAGVPQIAADLLQRPSQGRSGRSKFVAAFTTQHLKECSASGVRCDKAALSSGCKSHPANAPAGSSRSRQGGNELAEAFGKRVTNW